LSLILKSNIMKKILLSISFVLTFGLASAQNIATENFDVFPTTWTLTNQSSPVGASTWAQGGGTAFSTGGQAGGATSFALCNFQSTTGAGTISNWLITPTYSLQNGDVVTFYSRKGGTSAPPVYPDRMEVRLNSTDVTAAGNPTGVNGVGAFTTLALTINPNLNATDYPFVWTQYSYTVSGLTGVVPCKIGFRYFVTDGGPSGNNSDIIGLDTFSIDRTLGTADFFKSNFTVYPNPSSDVISIANNNNVTINSIEVSDMNGRIIKNVDANTTTFSVRELNAGVYFLKVTTADGVGTTKFVKQ
jgi:hypothetical protein